MTGAHKDLSIYVAMRRRDEQESTKEMLTIDGWDVHCFDTAEQLWERFQVRPVRMVITDRRFPGNMSALDLARNIRQHFLMPYVYIAIQSVMNRQSEIEEALAAGADDYLIKPSNRVQLRARILVGLRWLDYIDSLQADTAQAAS